MSKFRLDDHFSEALKLIKTLQTMQVEDNVNVNKHPLKSMTACLTVEFFDANSDASIEFVYLFTVLRNYKGMYHTFKTQKYLSGASQVDDYWLQRRWLYKYIAMYITKYNKLPEILQEQKAKIFNIDGWYYLDIDDELWKQAMNETITSLYN